MPLGEIIGQDKVIAVLKGIAESGRLQGGFLFSGPEGVGKKLVAVSLAKIINCQKAEFESCEICPSCLKINKGSHPDIHIISLEDNELIKIEQVRQLQKDIYLRAYEAKIKVFIIDNAHNLTAEASNALLKVLEEPPKMSLIILISSKPRLLFKTIVSRCRPVKFSSMPRHDLKRILESKHNLSAADAHFLAYFSEGRIGYAMRNKDGDIVKERQKILDSFLGMNVSVKDSYDISERQDFSRALDILALWFRDIYLLKAGIDESELANIDRRADIVRLAQRYSIEEVDSIIRTISESHLYLDQNVNVKLLFSYLRTNIWKN